MFFSINIQQTLTSSLRVASFDEPAAYLAIVVQHFWIFSSSIFCLPVQYWQIKNDCLISLLYKWKGNEKACLGGCVYRLVLLCSQESSFDGPVPGTSYPVQTRLSHSHLWNPGCSPQKEVWGWSSLFIFLQREPICICVT